MADAHTPGPERAANPFSPIQPEPLAKPKLLIGEGREEILFFQAILQHLKIANIQVEQYGGKTRLRDYLETLVRRPGFHGLVSLGITRDADRHSAGAFQSVCDALKATQLPVPPAVNKPIQGPPRTSIYIFPGRGKRGMLEDLCLTAVAHDPAMECVKEYFQCILRKAKRRPSNLSKARILAWLASQKEPDLRLGEAARKGYWPWTQRAFAGVRNYLQSS